MRTQPNPTIFRRDYQPAAFLIDEVELGFDLDPRRTIVANRMHVRRQAEGPLRLSGHELDLLFVAVDGQRLARSAFRVTGSELLIDELPDQCIVDVAVALRPESNTSLLGLYVSDGCFITHCEAEGFSRITYFADRPDIMARYSVMLRADKRQFPVLLSNGNQIASGDLGDGRHFALWRDPHRKPCYLFALVAGRFAVAEREVITASGKSARLQIYAPEGEIGRVGHAMDSLVAALKWDEARFGLELDLDRFMIVATSDFNMGAMENKGLNIFNGKYVFADWDSSTDADLIRIEAIIAHEYFHNWTGNRVTCRDWFQLTLKEGLTVFRDQEFTADRSALSGATKKSAKASETARAVHRIEAVRTLRGSQFPEDAGPMAHPIRPESYQEINNFYSSTVYEKGAEVVRMLQTLLGRERFRLGMDEYFRRFDGQAVTCDDFVDVMEFVLKQDDASASLEQFRRWYGQAGTPRLAVRGHYDEKAKRYTLSVSQRNPRVGVERLQELQKPPLHIPFSVGLVGPNGEDLPLMMASDKAPATATTRVLSVTEADATFEFLHVEVAPVPSLLRNFSAPVIVDFPYTDEELAHLSSHDSDAFNRWDALQRLAVRTLAARARGGEPISAHGPLVAAHRKTLLAHQLDPMLQALALTLPGEYVIGEDLPVYEPQAVHACRIEAAAVLGGALESTWRETYDRHVSRGSYSFDRAHIGQRAMSHCALGYLAAAGNDEAGLLAWQLFQAADNMTDRFAALTVLVNHGLPQAGDALLAFYRRHEAQPASIDKWLRVQSTAELGHKEVLARVQKLLGHKAFSLRNPNKVHALLGGFFISNPSAFHHPDSYAFWSEQITTIDRINPSVAGKLARALDRWQRLPDALQKAAQQALALLARDPNLSRAVREIIEKALRV